MFKITFAATHIQQLASDLQVHKGTIVPTRRRPLSSDRNMASAFLATADKTLPDCDITNDQINTLKDYIKDSISSEDAAKRLASHPEASSTPVELQQRLSGLWTLLNATAVNAKAAQPKIIALLQAIRQLPQAEVPKDEGADSTGNYWRELTNWANDWAEEFNSHASEYLMESTAEGPAQEQRKVAWSNACAYTARLAATGDDALSSYGAGLDRATSAISEAVEVNNAEGEPESLEAAAQLFKYAGPELYRRCKKNQAEGMSSGKNSQWKGDSGFSEPRWKFWHEKWSTFAENESFSHHTRRLAGEVCNAMEKAEESGK
jgi:hypothetical protein